MFQFAMLTLQMAAVQAIPALCNEYYKTSTGSADPQKQGGYFEFYLLKKYQ